MKVVLRIIIAVFLGMIVLALSGFISYLYELTEFSRIYTWLPVVHTTMLVASLILMLFLSRGKLSIYGVKLIPIKKLVKPILVGSLVAIVIIIASAFIPAEDFNIVEGFSTLQIIIFVWIYASICEEFLARGLIQGFLSPLVKYQKRIFNFHISIPMLVSALFFGAMHLGLVAVGGPVGGLTIVISAIILGLVAGYYRETSGSLLPAIIVHMLFNIWGSIIGFLVEWIF